MSHVTYKIVQHDGGWAYTVNGVFSEPFASHAAALAAARRAAAEQRVPGRTEAIEYETEDGKWHTETAAGSDRPEFTTPLVYSGFARVMLAGLLNVAVVDRPVIGSAFTALKMSPRNSKVLASLNFQKWNLRTTDTSGIIWGQYRM